MRRMHLAACGVVASALALLAIQACNALSGIDKYAVCTTCADADAATADGDTGLDAEPLDVRPDVDLDAPCETLPRDAADVYVDKLSPRESVGTRTCPFKTILEATERPFSGKVAVHVRGGESGVLEYVEAKVIRVYNGMTLVGDDGAAKTKLGGAGGTCGGAPCTVRLDGGSTLLKVTVTNTAASGDGILVSTTGGVAIVRDTIVTATAHNGITVDDGSALTASTLTVTDIGDPSPPDGGLFGTGIYATGNVRIEGKSNFFYRTGIAGILVSPPGSLEFQGGTISDSRGNAIQVSGGAHTITGLIARNNKGAGVGVVNGGIATVRLGTFIGNGIGVLVRGVTAARADLGSTDGGAGANLFAEADGGRNLVAAVCLGGANPPTEVEGNTWKACPPSSAALSCENTTGNYFDIIYGGDAGSPVIVPTGCKTAPP